MVKRFFLIVFDRRGIGKEPDGAEFGDEGSDTLASIRTSKNFHCPNLERLGLFNITGIRGGVKSPLAAYARMQERSAGKDTTIGHWEIAGLISEHPLPTYPNGFPKEIIDAFSKDTGRGILCNQPYSGTGVIRDYGKEHMQTGDLIVYTSADSVFQIAAHEDVVSVEELYRYCEIARDLLVGEHGVGRVIARPFEGEHPFKRTSRRRDYSLLPPKPTMLDALKGAGLDVISIGKIEDVFASQGITEGQHTENNADGMAKTAALAMRDFRGLCFVNLVDFDSVYGHRNDTDGYARALSAFDAWLGEFLPLLEKEDVLLITADHGCDPATPSTDHSRECTPMLLYGERIQAVDLGTRKSFADIAATVLKAFGVTQGDLCGESFWHLCCKK